MRPGPSSGRRTDIGVKMDEPLDDAANAAILERHFAEIQALYARAAGGEVNDEGDVQLSASGVPARVVNAANLARFSEASAAAGIASTQAFSARFGVPFRWFCGRAST